MAGGRHDVDDAGCALQQAGERLLVGVQAPGDAGQRGQRVRLQPDRVLARCQAGRVAGGGPVGGPAGRAARVRPGAGSPCWRRALNAAFVSEACNRWPAAACNLAWSPPAPCSAVQQALSCLAGCLEWLRAATAASGLLHVHGCTCGRWRHRYGQPSSAHQLRACSAAMSAVTATRRLVAGGNMKSSSADVTAWASTQASGSGDLRPAQPSCLRWRSAQPAAAQTQGRHGRGS